MAPGITDLTQAGAARALPGLRQDLRLMPGELQPDGAPAWRIHDPVRNRFFDIGWLEFELLSRWHEGGASDALLAAVAAESPLRPTAEELDALLHFLERHQLLAPSTAEQRDALKRRAGQGVSLWQQLLHHYLFFRVPLLRPDAWLGRSLPHLAWFLGRRFAVLSGAAGLLGLYLAGRQGDALASAFNYFFNLQGVLCYGMAAGAAKLVHELGHALTAKRQGLRVPTMGVAFLVMMPVLYTDTGESWKLTRPAQRFAVAFAGIRAELMLAAWSSLAWALLPDGPVRSGFFLLATTSWLGTLAINASPFMRFDGYFLLSDWAGLPNLHERSFALARRRVRQTLFGYGPDDPEPALADGAKRAMVAFAFATWAYRLVLFLGIAYLVYAMFFKLLGIFLFAVEIAWFLVLPVYRELADMLRERAAWRWRPKAWGGLLLLLLGVLWLVPVNRSVSAPALARAAHEASVFASSPARLVEIHVTAEQSVVKGQILLRLESPELLNRAERAHLRAQGYASEVSRGVAGSAQLERRRGMEEQWGEALADEVGAKAEIQALTLVAPLAGQVRDLAPDLTPGRWVNGRRPLLRIVAQEGSEIEAYLDENQVAVVQAGQSVNFYPDDPGLPVLSGTVTAIDTAAGHQIPHALLSSSHGGGIAAVAGGQEGGKVGAKEAGVAHEAIYRVRIRTAPGQPPYAQVVRGSVRIHTDWLYLAGSSLSHALSVLIRESGF